MGLSGLLEFVDAIEWSDPDPGVLAYRFPSEEVEIQKGAPLIVEESQMAAIVSEGRIAEVFGPGRYTLAGSGGVFFVSTRIQIDQRWGTATPITIHEKDLGAVRVRVYGVYSYRISDPRAFLALGVYFAEDLELRLRAVIEDHLSGLLAPANSGYADLAARVSEAVRPAFARLGVELDSFVIT